MNSLILFESARDALAECKSVDEVKDWADRAAATQAYAKMAKDKTLEVDAAEIRIRAERRLGEMLAEQKSSGNMAKGHRFTGGTRDGPPAPPTLAEVGIDKNLSARAQKIAAVPRAEFEAEVGEWRERVSAEGERVTARLETSGAAHQTSKQEAPDLGEDIDFDPDAEIHGDYEALQRLLDADDKLAEAWSEVKTWIAKYEDLDRLYAAQRLELAKMTGEAKRHMRKAEALEKKLQALEKRASS